MSHETPNQPGVLSDQANGAQVLITPGKDWLTQSTARPGWPWWWIAMARAFLVTLHFEPEHRGHPLLHFGHDSVMLGESNEGFQAIPRIQPSNWASARSEGLRCGWKWTGSASAASLCCIQRATLKASCW